jgi:hypothetical protein
MNLAIGRDETKSYVGYAQLLKTLCLALIIPPWAANALPRFGNVTRAKSAANAVLHFHLRIDAANGYVIVAVV